MSSSEFNRDSGAAKRAAQSGPVIITERGAPAHVLLTWGAYQNLLGARETIAQAITLPGVEDVPFDPPRLGDRPVAADLA